MVQSPRKEVFAAISSIRILRHVAAQPGGIADLDSFVRAFDAIPQKHLDYLVQRGLLEYRLSFAEDDLQITGYELTAQGLDLLADRLHRQKLNQRRKENLAYQNAERDWRDALDRVDKAQDARKARQHSYLVAVFSVIAQTFVEKLPYVVAAIRKLLGV